MFLPFDDDNPTRCTPWVTYALVAVNVLVFVWMLHLSPEERGSMTLHRGFVPARMAQLVEAKPVVVVQSIPVWHPQHGRGFLRKQVTLKPEPGQVVFSLLTCMFLHAGWVHLIGNMWFLWLFGNNVEDRLGHVVFVLFYLAGGLFGSGCHWLFYSTSTTPVIGASGAVAAVLGAYAVTWPWARVRTLIFVFVVELPALGVLGTWFVIELMRGQAELELPGVGNVASWAHVGGFIAGMALMLLLTRVFKIGEPPGPPCDPGDIDACDHIIDVKIVND